MPSDPDYYPLCTTRRCEEKAVIEATEVKGQHHLYCIHHLWQVEESDQVTLVGDFTSRRPQAAALPAPAELPVTIAEPIYDSNGFSVGFRIVHPPGVECVFHPDTKQCPCGKTER